MEEVSYLAYKAKVTTRGGPRSPQTVKLPAGKKDSARDRILYPATRPNTTRAEGELLVLPFGL